MAHGKKISTVLYVIKEWISCRSCFVYFSLFWLGSNRIVRKNEATFVCEGQERRSSYFFPLTFDFLYCPVCSVPAYYSRCTTGGSSFWTTSQRWVRNCSVPHSTHQSSYPCVSSP